jgi:hypothetical protein
MLPMTWMVPSEAELEALLAAGEAWKWYHDPEGNIIAYAPGYDHIGDIDWVSKGRLGAMNPLWNEPGGHQGYVFASMEEDGPKHPTGMVAAFYDNMQDEANAYDGVFRWGSSPLFPGFDADTFKVDGILRPQHHCPWCAINPWDGLLYTSPFNPPYDASQDISYLYRFDIHNRTVLTLQELRALAFPLHVVRFLGGQTATSLPVFAFAGVFPIKGHLTRIQGGSFSTDGSLFLASDGEDSEEAPNPGLWRISMLTGQVLDKVGINREYDPYSKWYRDWESQEVEGVCLSGGSQGSGSGPGSDGQDRYLCTGVWWWKGGGGNDWVFLKARRVP